MSHIPGYTIRTMTRLEIDLAADWAAAESWNPGLEDAECFYHADPKGFLVGSMNDEPVSCISVVRYGKSFGFLGFYIVKPEYCGLGLGLKIWKAGLQRLDGRLVGLDGVVAQQENYRNIRYMGVSIQSREVGRAFTIRQNGKLVGYGLIRPCRNGFKIGPLFANRPELAEALFSASTARFLKAPRFSSTYRR
ncbi:GNAT family N-acetyltransferase [Chlorobaculum sp. MV4-Y]|nr:GNAT family N-acetyltransferase [Chlorobaculum sp. MV4-Y]UWX58519.1 GNAT family N-acetyltransferase [Chlorobaculum sp. MV4-Y]